MTNETVTNSNGNMHETPGQILRLQREKLELSKQEIAKRIYLDVKIIDSIENDSLEGMPSAIYVRGYLRSYAKIVGADADKIIGLYNAGSPPPVPDILPEIKTPTQASSNDKQVKVFTYLITLALVLLLLIWYQSNFVVDEKTNVGQIDTETSINGVDITYDIINHPDTWQFPIINSNDGTKETIETPEKNDLLKLEAHSEEQTIEISTVDLMDNDLPLSINSDPDIIELSLTSDSWVEIYDKNKNRLFYDLALNGEQYNITGVAPFNVMLGFSKGVKLKFNGKLFDVESYSKNGVARFTLPE